MAMSAPAKFQLIETGGDAPLAKALALYEVDLALIEFITREPVEGVAAVTGTESVQAVEGVAEVRGLGMRKLEDLANVAEPDVPGDVSQALKAIRDSLPKTTGNILQFSRLRTCYLDVRKQLASVEEAVTKVVEPEQEDSEKPLDKPTQVAMKARWKATYSSNLWFEGQATPSDGLVGRVYREFINHTMTLITITRVRTVLMDKKPQARRQVPLGNTADGMEISVNMAAEQGNVTMGSVFEYYIGLTVLMNAWAFAGSYLVDSRDSTQTTYDGNGQVPARVVYFDMGRGMQYASFALRRTLEYAAPGSELAWLESKDLITRGLVVTLTREGHPAGEALAAALKETALEWKSGAVSGEPDAAAHLQTNTRPAAAGRKSKARSRSPAASSATTWRANELVNRAGSRKLCAKFQRNQCSEPCPQKNLHECWLKLKGSSKHCGSSGRRHSAVDCTNRNTVAGH